MLTKLACAAALAAWAVAAPASTVTTDDGAGADTYVIQWDYSGVHEGETTFRLRGDTETNTRIGYLRFDLSGLEHPASTVREAALSLTVIGLVVSAELEVYGLLDADPSETWNPARTSWSNAPARAGSELDPNRVTPLGSWQMAGLTSGDDITFQEPALAEHIAASRANDLVTLILLSRTDSIIDFKSAEGAKGDRAIMPRLQVAPEPTSLALLAVGAACLRRRRRGV